eukprot:COSAG02_NODE_206_length_29144_cov_12.855121_31_plen_551_part_00
MPACSRWARETTLTCKRCSPRHHDSVKLHAARWSCPPRHLCSSGWTLVDKASHLVVSRYHVVLSLWGLLFFTVLFEHGLHSLQHLLGASDSPGNQLLQKAKDELMILGFISFCLTVVGEFVEIPHVLLLPFEFAHVLVFMVALCLIAFVPAALRILRDTENHWDALDAAKTDDIIDKLAGGAAPAGSFEREAAYHRATMHAFCATMNLPPTFDFSVYQRHALTDHLLELLEVSAGSWAAIGATAALIYAVSSNAAALGLPGAPGYVEFLVLGGCLVCVVCGLRTQMRRARESLAKVLEVEDDKLLLRRLKKIHQERLAYHKQSVEKQQASYVQARETISTSRRDLFAHGSSEGHEVETTQDKQYNPATGSAARWKKLRAWVNQPLINIAHVLHLDDKASEHHGAHLDAHGVFVFDSPHAAFQSCAVGLMLTMFYAALLVMRYMRSAWISVASPAEAVAQCALMTAPVPICAILLSRAIADFSYVACLVHPNSDLLDEALTQTLETREMKTELRQRFIRHFKANGGESIEDVVALFQRYVQLLLCNTPHHS